MPVSAGTHLGQYDIISPLGAGGMGEVYRARDTKLGRSVAIKVLPDAVATHPDRIARLQREARVLASLNHPHIAALFGMEESSGRHLLVMELVEGETLAERIAASGRGLRVEDTLKIALQIAAALEAAHESGIIHRDLKPANIKITPDDVVKVLDFGLAKATEGDRSGQDLSPTVSFGGTREGTILGTAAYMSPEQARGKPVDRRTDIWAFGCVVYEMLTGRIAFSGETVSDAVAAILSREPDWLALPAETPERVRRLLRRSLEKDPKRRVHDIADVRIELEDTLDEPPTFSHARPADPAAPPIVAAWASVRMRERLAWIIAALSVAATIAALALGRIGFFDRSVDARVYRSSIDLPEGSQIPGDRSSANLGPAGRFALSPDGRHLAFVARRDATGSPMLWVRPLDSVVAQSLAGTETTSFSSLQKEGPRSFACRPQAARHPPSPHSMRRPETHNTGSHSFCPMGDISSIPPWAARRRAPLPRAASTSARSIQKRQARSWCVMDPTGNTRGAICSSCAAARSWRSHSTPTVASSMVGRSRSQNRCRQPVGL